MFLKVSHSLKPRFLNTCTNCMLCQQTYLVVEMESVKTITCYISYQSITSVYYFVCQPTFGDARAGFQTD